MTTSPDRTERTIVLDVSDPIPGRVDPVRFRNPKLDDAEVRPVRATQDYEATRAELDELRSRMSRKHA